MSQPQSTASETVVLTQAQQNARKKRGILLALALFGFVILVFVITLVRLGENAAKVAESRGFSNAVEYFSEDGSKLSANGEVLEAAPASEENDQNEEASQ